jgi:hypothetical protein
MYDSLSTEAFTASPKTLILLVEEDLVSCKGADGEHCSDGAVLLLQDVWVSFTLLALEYNERPSIGGKKPGSAYADILVLLCYVCVFKK